MSYQDSTQKENFMFNSVNDIEQQIKETNERLGTLLPSDECQKVVNYFGSHLHRICSKIKLPESVIYTNLLLYTFILITDLIKSIKISKYHPSLHR